MTMDVLKFLANGPVIPSARSMEDFKIALTHTVSPSVVLLFGDINTLPTLISQANEHKKRIILHLDLLDGIGKDKAGIKFLARLGIHAIITTKSHLCRFARDEGMIVVQRLFLMDSDSLRTGLNLVRNFKPDAIEILPGSVPESAVQELVRETGLPILAGGLIRTKEDVNNAIERGISAVSTSRRDLWDDIMVNNK
ncbi:glycerol-3-phosphate responsive antiterminator [Pelosinus baikalensis]|uniref:Glycerol-3-phosphate responsive antiterminator n=1 Tax=Pelosinus baikalensis TaxID=2892015 RepID=A0ABS8HY25_9FIRM|nr:glycerol-3-phosphate responsive antiterminator [Pelosinus baikalensis]MCC5467920.1 glycerol-3-phosphate responsive antiterminator [Pelosinus baikalensis]